MKQYRFEVVISFDDEVAPDEIDEDYLDLGALYYGDKHQGFSLTTVPGTIEEILK